MNWLYIVVMAYIVLSALRGFHKGFLRVVYSMSALLITIVFVAFAAPVISHMIQEYTPVEHWLTDRSEKYVREQIGKKLEDEDTSASILTLPGNVLPEEIQEILAEGNKTVIADILESEDIYRKFAEKLAVFCINLISFAAALAVIWLVLLFAGRKLDLFSKIPGVHITNMFFGFIAGIVKAFIVIWLFFLIIKITSIVPASAYLIELIEEDGVLKSMYDQNRLLDLLQKMSFLK